MVATWRMCRAVLLSNVIGCTLIGCAANGANGGAGGASGTGAIGGSGGVGGTAGSSGAGGTAGSSGVGGTAGSGGFGGVGGFGGLDGGGGAAGMMNCNQDVDVVFVLDVSGSMIPPLTTVVEEVGMVDAALLTKNLPNPPHYGLVIFVDDVIVMNGGAPYADIAALIAAVTAEINATNTNPARQAGPTGRTNLDWPENSLDALHAAATQYQWRPVDSTLRTVIHVTDASFWDLTAVSSAAGDPMMLEANGAGYTSVQTFDQTITALRDHSVWVNTFAAKTGGPPGFGLSPPSHGLFRGVNVNVGIGFHQSYDGKPSIAASTGGLSWDIDEVFDGVISLATPINQAIEQSQCMEYPPIPPPD